MLSTVWKTLGDGTFGLCYLLDSVCFGALRVLKLYRMGVPSVLTATLSRSSYSSALRTSGNAWFVLQTLLHSFVRVSPWRMLTTCRQWIGWPACRTWSSEGGRVQVEVRIRGGRHRCVGLLLKESVRNMSSCRRRS